MRTITANLPPVAHLIADYLKSPGQEFLVIGHQRPDPDCYAAVGALVYGLRLAGQRAWGMFEEPVPEQYRPFFPTNLIRDTIPAAQPTVIALDAGDPGRLYPAVSKVAIWLDHHLVPANTGEICWADAGRASTAELVFEILNLIGVQIDRLLATLLYLGIAADSGVFRFEKTCGRTHEIIACLHQAGANFRTIRQAMSNISLVETRILGLVASRIIHLPELGLAYSWLTLADLTILPDSSTPAATGINIMENIREAPLALLICEVEDRCWQVTLRSREGQPPANAIAAPFGGRGQIYGASFIARGTLEDIIALILPHIDQPDTERNKT